MKFILSIAVLLTAVAATPAFADCFHTCLSRIDCKMKVEDGKPVGEEKCVQVYEKCEGECKSSYGAVAIGPTTGAWGLSRKSEDAKAAAASAASLCSQRGARDCQVVGQFKNICAAVAKGGNVTSWAGAVDVNAAGADALSACAQKGGQGCTLRHAECYFN
jgi:hypothetical protein